MAPTVRSLELFAAGLLALCLAAVAAVPPRLEGGAPPRPSFLLLFTDDQRWDAFGHVNPVLETPHMDALAAEGVYFPNAFVTTSICPASRATILTGLHERTHGYTFFTPPLSASFTARSHPALLRAAGYRTGMIGKDGVEFEAGAVEQMFDVFVPLSRRPSYFKEQPDGTLRHLTDIVGDHVEAFLASQDPGQPFSLWVTFNAPHAQEVRVDGEYDSFFEWPTRFDDLYAEVTFPLPPTYDPGFLETQPEFLQESENRIRGEALWNPEEFQENLRAYHRMIAGVDDVVGRIRNLLAANGRAGDTVILLLSDNGYFVGERGGFSGKWLPHEPSIRVPMIVYDPRQPGGRVREHAVLNLDVAPTLLELAGVAVPGWMQGRSLVPLLQPRPAPGWRDDFFVEHLMDPEPFPIPRHEGVRTVDGWKYAHYFDHGYEELYHLTEDPWEERNLADDPGFADRLAELRARTAELRRLYDAAVFADGFESGDLSAWGPGAGARAEATP